MPETAPSSASIRRVLVADDEPHVRRILVTLLEARSLEVEIAVNGTSTMELLESDRRYDVVLLDLMMPGASGLEVLERLRQLDHRRDLSVVILTAKGQETDRQRAFMLGADDFVTKPFSPKKLLALIDTLLGDV